METNASPEQQYRDAKNEIDRLSEDLIAGKSLTLGEKMRIASWNIEIPEMVSRLTRMKEERLKREGKEAATTLKAKFLHAAKVFKKTYHQEAYREAVTDGLAAFQKVSARADDMDAFERQRKADEEAFKTKAEAIKTLIANQKKEAGDILQYVSDSRAKIEASYPPAPRYQKGRP